MNLRILGHGQYDIPEGELDALNELDERLVRAVDGGDDDAFAEALGQLLARVRTSGTQMPDDFLGSSDLVLPGPDATVDEVRAMLDDEGLIPG